LLIDGYYSLAELAFIVTMNKVAGWPIYETLCMPLGDSGYLCINAAVYLNLSLAAALPEWWIQESQSLRTPDMCFSIVG